MSVPTIAFMDKDHFINYLCDYILPQKTDQKVIPNSIQGVKLVLNIDTKHGLTIGFSLFSKKNELPYYVFMHYTSNFDNVPGQKAILKFATYATNSEEYDTLIHFFETVLGFKVYKYFHTT